MKSEWLQYMVLRAASLLAPGDQRAEWLEGWRSELWYIPRREATRFCLGAFRDAVWLRRNNLSPMKRSLIYLESPLRCLTLLAILAAVSSLIAVLLPGPPQPGPWPSHMRASDLTAGCVAMFLLTCVLLPATRLAMGGARADRQPMPWPNRLRRGVFLALKIALVQPIMLCGFVVLLLAGPLVPLAPQLGLFATWILTFRWVITDQRRRCPVCLRLLTNAVRIGNSSHTFLEWYGAESICSRGHGLRHIPEISASYSGRQEWLTLDDSWTSLFSEAAGVRQR
jgi:hypothetical protein